LKQRRKKKVHWRVRLSPPDWEGSIINWELTPISNGSRLLFGQHDLCTGYSIDEARAGWEYLLLSLKLYLETGKGTPYVY
jgi:hypothetical protein